MKTKTKKGNTMAISLIIIIVAITAGVFGWYFAKNTQNTKVQVKENTISQKKEIENKIQEPIIEKQEQGILYKNDKYGFQFRLPAKWQNYKVVINENPQKNVQAYVYFDIPTTDKNWPGDLDPKTGKNLYGFASMIAVTVWNIDGYNAELKRCKTEQDPSCPGGEELKNNKHAFQLTRSQALPEDLLKMEDANDYLDPIMETFSVFQIQ